MSSSKDQKQALYKLAVEHGIRNPGELHHFLPLGTSVPESRLRSWIEKFLQVPKDFHVPKRYVNRFKIGADPEFCFAERHGTLDTTRRVEAHALGLAQGPAFGADNNGRLAEIRPYPSRSCVEVVASILTTLRWMATLCPNTMNFEWHCGAYLWDDGIGGHVHFGRKRPTRKSEIAALDHVEEGLLSLGVYPVDQVLRRRQGDARRQVYGALGDYRLQQHGYEYRTYPSWLDSPELAFLTLVLSKLAVFKPNLYVRPPNSFPNPQIEFARIRNFLAYFKCVDDDARLALILLNRGLPSHKGGDFRPRWGIPQMPPTGKPEPKVVPLSIKPDRRSVDEVFAFLFDARPLSFRVPEMTWTTPNPPRNYLTALSQTNTILQKGLGELIWDLCVHNSTPLRLVSGHRGDSIPIRFSPHVAKLLPRNWQSKLKGLAGEDGGHLGSWQMSIAPDWREGQRAKEIKSLILNGVIPIWKLDDVKPDSYSTWKSGFAPSPGRKYQGEVVYSSHDYRFGPLEE